MNYYPTVTAKKLFANGQFVGAQIIKKQDCFVVKLLSNDGDGWLVVLGQQVRRLNLLGEGIAAARAIGFSARQLKIMQ